MRQPVIPELISGKPNWTVLFAHPALELTPSEERYVFGTVDDQSLAPESERLPLDSLRVELASEAVVRLVSISVGRVRPHDQPLAQLTGMSKTLLRAASAKAVKQRDQSLPLRLGRIAGRVWIIDCLRRFCLPWPAPSQVEQAALELMDEIFAEAEPLLRSEPELEALARSWRERTDELRPQAEDPVWREEAQLTRLRHALRYQILRVTGGILAPVPIGGPSRPYLQSISQASAWMAWKRDTEMFPWLLAASAVIHRFETSHRPKDERILFHWAMHHLLGRAGVLPGGANVSSTRRIGVLMMQPAPSRESITAGIHLPPASTSVLGRLETEFATHHRTKANRA
jgi:hypothetical protein